MFKIIQNDWQCCGPQEEYRPYDDVVGVDPGWDQAPDRTPDRTAKAVLNHCLLLAARDGDLFKIQEAIRSGAWLETRRPLKMQRPGTPNEAATRPVGLTPLMYVAFEGYVDAVDFLLRRGAKIDAIDEDGMTPLHFAALAGCQASCRALVLAGANTAALDDDGRTPLDVLTKDALFEKADRVEWTAILCAPADI